MPGLFPGIDPYLEAQGYWPDFHIRFHSALSESLNDRLPDKYEARMDERFTLIEAEVPWTKAIEPGVAILRRPGLTPRTAVLEPRILPLAMPVVIEERQVWIEVRRRRDRSPVAVIELLSPTNKSGVGWQEYVEKRNGLLIRKVHLIELDFLAEGRRMPLEVDYPEGDFHAVVSRAETRPDCLVFSWSVRQPLPVIPIPLKAPDADVTIDLAAVYATTYERGRYRRSVDYGASLDLALAGDGRAGAEGVGREERVE